MGCLDKIFKEKSEWINIYQGIETVDDPYEKNVTVSLISPKTIKAIVTDITFAKTKWSMPGVKTSKVKRVVTKRYPFLDQRGVHVKNIYVSFFSSFALYPISFQSISHT